MDKNKIEEELKSYGVFGYSTLDDKRVVLLQSGGLDSCFLASLFSYYGFEIHHLFANYGQNSVSKELECALKIVDRYGGTLHTCDLRLPWLEGSTRLVNGTVNDWGADSKFNAIYESTYVPMRNAMLLSVASSLCESLDIQYIACAFDGEEGLVDHKPCGGTTDKHPTFVRKMEDALIEGSSMYHVQHKSIRILTPIMNKFKETTIYLGSLIGTDFSLSWSCYNKGDKPCCKCSACSTRIKAFENVGLVDPLLL